MSSRPESIRPVDPAALGIKSNHAEIDTGVAHPARVYDYILGGKDNYPVDRAIAEQVIERIPNTRDEVWANRQWLRRGARYSAAQGVAQFLDIGTGIPTAGPTHDAAQTIQPTARVVYVDNDPIVLTHARALLVDDDRTTVVQADVRDPETVLGVARKHLDFTRPIALMFVGLLYFITDDDLDGVLDRYRSAMPGGSHLLITHARDSPELNAAKEVYKTSAPLVPRSHRQIEELFAGWDVVPPGVVPLHEWKPDGDERRCAHMLGGVGVKRDAPR